VISEARSSAGDGSSWAQAEKISRLSIKARIIRVGIGQSPKESQRESDFAKNIGFLGKFLEIKTSGSSTGTSGSIVCH
jgi:hypothetical protein